MNHQEIVRRWIERIPSGRSGLIEYHGYGNISFRNDTIYSYGWWPMAKVIDWDKKIAFYRNYGYSVSTSKHQSYVWNALNQYGFKIFSVPNVTDFHHFADNLKDYENSIGKLLDIADRAYLNRKYYMEHADKMIKEMSEYIDLFMS